ncbi:MAG: sulfurtransferase TusA family protein [Cellvibrionaceae bacterium]
MVEECCISKTYFDDVVDARGLTCPLPLLKAKQGLKPLDNGEVLKVLATDPGSVRDFKSFVQLSPKVELTLIEENGDEYIYFLKKLS